jgi:HPt (histidine-containing phosphotransfer) domain-containing protein
MQTNTSYEPTEHDLLDHAHLTRQTFGDPVFEREILGMLLSELPRYLDELAAAVADPAQGWRRTAHTLKGAARAVGANMLASAAETAEHLDPAAASPMREAALDAVRRAAWLTREAVERRMRTQPGGVALT